METTTGPLAQGLATSVGMAIAQKWMAARFNKSKFNLVDYSIYALCGDGCLMEGLSSEAASLAGHLSLSSLCWIYDNNSITIEGNTNLAFSENIKARFESYGWNVTRVHDANSLKLLRQGFSAFLNNNVAPTLIIVDSKIGFGSPAKQGTASAHGEPLGKDEIELTKENYKWPSKAKFEVPPEVLQHFKDGIFSRGAEKKRYWSELFGNYKKSYPELAQEFSLMQNGSLPENWDKDLRSFEPDAKGMATRTASGQVLNSLGQNIPWLIGGSADLGPSTKTTLTFPEAKSFSNLKPCGRNLHFGIRENCMASALNGLCLSNIIAYGSTFLTFMDYLRPGLRLSALMNINPVFIFTHDSIGVGEDGPTHQPIEHLASLRSMPGLITFRPADANEVIECWRVIMGLKNTPSALVLTRQALPIFDRANMGVAANVKFGAYTLLETLNAIPDIILLATGSEVHLCVQAYLDLKNRGINARVVSMPSFELFEQQSQEYKNSILPIDLKARIAVEQASSFGWERYAGDSGDILAMNSFGKSAPSQDLQAHFGFNVENIVKLTFNQLAKFK